MKVSGVNSSEPRALEAASCEAAVVECLFFFYFFFGYSTLISLLSSTLENENVWMGEKYVWLSALSVAVSTLERLVQPFNCPLG
jgi:hypothetical protein